MRENARLAELNLAQWSSMGKFANTLLCAITHWLSSTIWRAPMPKNAAEAELRRIYRQLGTDVDDLIDRIPEWEREWVLETLKEAIAAKGLEQLAAEPHLRRSSLEQLLTVL